MEILTNNSGRTKKLGEILAKEILKKEIKNKAIVLGLEGDLGGGKTTFLQGFAKGLGIKEKIVSPTFIIMRKFDVRGSGLDVKHQSSNLRHFYHIDCYRIEKPKKILDLGFKEIISNPKNIITIEWADRIKKILPKDSLIIKFKFVNKNTRKIIINVARLRS